MVGIVAGFSAGLVVALAVGIALRFQYARRRRMAAAKAAEELADGALNTFEV